MAVSIQHHACRPFLNHALEPSLPPQPHQGASHPGQHPLPVLFCQMCLTQFLCSMGLQFLLFLFLLNTRYLLRYQNFS